MSSYHSLNTRSALHLVIAGPGEAWPGHIVAALRRRRLKPKGACYNPLEQRQVLDRSSTRPLPGERFQSRHVGEVRVPGRQWQIILAASSGVNPHPLAGLSVGLGRAVPDQSGRHVGDLPHMSVLNTPAR